MTITAVAGDEVDNTLYLVLAGNYRVAQIDAIHPLRELGVDPRKIKYVTEGHHFRGLDAGRCVFVYCSRYYTNPHWRKGLREQIQCLLILGAREIWEFLREHE